MFRDAVLDAWGGGEPPSIEAVTVKGVVGLERMAEIAGVPAFVRGIVWFAGDVLAVVDVKARCGLGRTPLGGCTCIAVVNVVTGGRSLTFAVLIEPELDVMGALEFLTRARAVPAPARWRPRGADPAGCRAGRRRICRPPQACSRRAVRRLAWAAMPLPRRD